MVQPLDYHYTDLVVTPWMLITIPYGGVLGLYTIKHKTILCYTQTLQTQVPFEDELGICKLSDIILSHINNM